MRLQNRVTSILQLSCCFEFFFCGLKGLSTSPCPRSFGTALQSQDLHQVGHQKRIQPHPDTWEGQVEDRRHCPYLPLWIPHDAIWTCQCPLYMPGLYKWDVMGCFPPFYSGLQNSRPHPTPVPFFPELYEELKKIWDAPFSARSSFVGLTSLDGQAARCYVDVPQVERAVPVHLCPQIAATCVLR